MQTTYPLLSFLGNTQQLNPILNILVRDTPKELGVALPQFSRRIATELGVMT